MKRVLSVLLAVLLLCALALPAAAFNDRATPVKSDDFDRWADMIAETAAAYLMSCGTEVEPTAIRDAVRAGMGKVDDPEGYAAGIESAADRSEIINVLSGMEVNTVLGAFVVVLPEKAAETALSFEATAGTTLTQNLFCDYYAHHVKMSDDALTAAVMAYYDEHAETIIPKLQDAVPLNMSYLKGMLTETAVHDALQTYISKNAEGFNRVMEEIATSFVLPEVKEKMICVSLKTALTGMVDQMLAASWPGTNASVIPGLPGMIDSFATSYAKTIAEQYESWLASALSGGSLAIVTGVAGLAVGAAGALLITKKKKTAAADAE